MCFHRGRKNKRETNQMRDREGKEETTEERSMMGRSRRLVFLVETGDYRQTREKKVELMDSVDKELQLYRGFGRQ
ncbi:hypothetical protein L2E82_18411 [Cichorium intybus]|uniref:Uncharacterized protein n=1 Tax=Cichorium intybus TaxID=13427 RepID=A0ACB9FBG7_CICIN|nr:hypothetical protein L2E82_18411 [Cichorium intybus]